MRARGFTLIEMLVVIGVIATLMGIGIGTYLSGNKVNELVAAERFLADQIRQARHTARTTGAPVILELDATDHTVTGLTQEPLYSLTAEPNAPVPAGEMSEEVETQGGRGYGMGFTGAAIRPRGYDPTKTDTDNQQPDEFNQPTNDLSDPARLRLPLRLRERDAIGGVQDERIWLSVRVWLPRLGGGMEPVVCIAPGGAEDDVEVPLPIMGLLVRGVSHGIAPSPVSLSHRSWNVVGWVSDGANDPVEIDLAHLTTPPRLRGRALSPGVMVDDELPPGMTPPSTPEDDLFDPMPGEAWEEFALLYDTPRQQLTLYRNGRRVAVRNGVGVTFPPPGADQRLVLAQIWPRPATAMQYADSIRIDDVRIARLASTQPRALPGSVTLKQDAVITCHPDGRVEVGNAGGLMPGSETLTLTSDKGVAEITIDGNGQITSQVTIGKQAD